MIKGIRSSNFINKRFLITPIPFNNELLSSWFVRTAYSHLIFPQTFFNLYFGIENRDLLKCDIDCSSNEILWEGLTKKTFNSINLKKLSLTKYSNYLQEENITNASNRFFSSLKFCPMCLNENICFFKQHWKLEFINVCSKHHCFLHDCCPKCLTKIDILKMFNSEKIFKYCHHCTFDLGCSQVELYDKKYRYGLIGQEKILNILNNGYIQFKEHFVYSFWFFDVINQLAKLILLRKNLRYISKLSLYYYLRNTKEIEYSSSVPIYKQLSIKEKFAFFGIVMYLFESYPKNLSCFIFSNNLTHWKMLKEIRYQSYWYENLINDIVPNRISFGNLITKQELILAKKYLKSKGIHVNKANLSRLFNTINFFNKLQI